MDRLRDISDDCDVAEFDQTVLKGFEIKRLLPGQWLCDGSINAWFEYLISNCGLDRHTEVKLVLPTIMGGMLMPIKVGGKLRSPRAHAAAATQEICDCWEVEWHSIRLLVLPLADGYQKSGRLQGHHWSLLIYMHQDEALRGFYHFDSQPGEEHHRLAAEAASYFAPLIPGRRCCAEVRSFPGMPRQANSHDCGVMVAACAEWILSQFLSGARFPWDAAELGSFLCHGDGSRYRLKMADVFVGWDGRK